MLFHDWKEHYHILVEDTPSFNLCQLDEVLTQYCTMKNLCVVGGKAHFVYEISLKIALKVACVNGALGRKEGPFIVSVLFSGFS